VKNLENVQGDERDIIIMSVCYGHDASGGADELRPDQPRGGESELNVISPAPSITWRWLVQSVTTISPMNKRRREQPEEFPTLRRGGLEGDAATTRRVLENLNPLSRKALAH